MTFSFRSNFIPQNSSSCNSANYLGHSNKIMSVDDDDDDDDGAVECVS